MSRVSEFKVNLTCLVVDQITSQLLLTSIDVKQWYLPQELHYADPKFFTSSPIDILIGAELFFNPLLLGWLSPGENLPRLQQTHFNWVVVGTFPIENASTSKDSLSINTHIVQSAILKFLMRNWIHN